jgi:hypothetical protein
MDTPLPSDTRHGSLGPLNGWKEIAAYLRKSVRAVQRWERDHHLPVHRIKTPGGQIVYAFRTEIDAWRSAMDPQLEPKDGLKDWLTGGMTPGEPPADPSDARGSELDTADAGSETRGIAGRHVEVVISLAVTLGIIFVAVGLVARRSGAAPLAPNEIIVSQQSLVALSEGGATLWSHRLGWTPGLLRHRSPPGRVTYIQADIDGDALEETFVAVHAPEGSGAPWRETVYCFSSTGQLRWSYTPDLKLSFGSQLFDGPWRIYALVASTSPGRQRVWASYGHHTWWPSFVVELDSNGRGVPKYFQAGAIYSVTHWNTGARNYLVAGGVSNAHEAAAVAVLDIDGPAVAGPNDSVAAKFRCDSCPNGRPEFFAVLPRTEVSEVSDVAYNWL